MFKFQKEKCTQETEGKVIKTGTPEEIKKATKTTNLRDSFFALIGGAYNEE